MRTRFTFFSMAPAATCLLAAALLSGCQALVSHADAPKSMGPVTQITSISPDASQTLRAGQRVKMKVDVNYVLPRPSGSITLIVLAADSSSLAHAVKQVVARSGSVTLEVEFTVPNTPVVRVFTPPATDGPASSSVVDGRVFTVLAQ